MWGFMNTLVFAYLLCKSKKKMPNYKIFTKKQ